MVELRTHRSRSTFRFRRQSLSSAFGGKIDPSLMIKLPAIPTRFTAVLAEREFVLQEGGKKRKIRLKIGIPTQDVPTVSGLDWRCPFRLTGVTRKNRMLQAYGIDSLQSLIHALALIEMEMAAIEKQYGKHILWLRDLPHGCPKIELGSLTQYNVAEPDGRGNRCPPCSLAAE